MRILVTRSIFGQTFRCKMTVNGTNNHHLGHFVKKSLLHNPDTICQIDAATGEEETRGSVLTRSVSLAKYLRRLGYQPGDVLALGGENHLDLHIPFYAALMNGYPIAGVDPLYKFEEIKRLFQLITPKVAFCQRHSFDDYQKAVEELGLDTRLVAFDSDDNTMTHLIQDCDKCEFVEDFEIANFDTDKIFAWFVSTSGSTGMPKVAAIKHGPILKQLTFLTAVVHKTTEPALNNAAVQWVSAFFNAITMPAVNQIKVQTSAPATVEHTIDIINKYKPVSMMSTPSILYRILRHDKPCDLTCFKHVIVAGASIHKTLLVDLREALPADAQVIEAYGQTECLGPVLQPVPGGPLGNCGIEKPVSKIQLVDPVTGEKVTEPNISGELWYKGPTFSEYYKNPEETAKAFTLDGWYKIGDLLRRDENGYFHFVERLKMLIKFRSYHVAPMEVEVVILKHEDVDDVCVTSIRSEEDGEWPAAVVVRAPGSAVSAKEIKDLVANNLSEHKQLRGGVLFVDSLPMTSSGKVARAKVKKLVETAHLE